MSTSRPRVALSPTATVLLLLVALVAPPGGGASPAGTPHDRHGPGQPPGDSRVEAGDTAPWVWPTGGRAVVRGWEQPTDEYAAGHRGIDVATVLGTTAVAVADGTVSFAGPVAGRGVVTIDHGSGLVSTLDSVDPAVTAGTTVEQGDPVGTVAVGHCPATAPCVHLGARVDGRYVDPLPYLPAADWPVLLPGSAWPG